MRWCFLIICTSQFPGDQKCRYIPSQEKRKVKEFYFGLPDVTALRGSKELPMLQSLPCYVPSCEHRRGGFLFTLCLSHCCQRVSFWHCLLLFWAWCPAAGSFWRRLPPACATCWRMGRGQAVRQPWCHAQPAACPCLWGSSQLYFGIQHPAGKIFPAFCKNNKEKEERVTLWAVAVPAFSPPRKQGICFQGSWMSWASK